MRQSLIFLLLFAVGVILSLFGWIPEVLLSNDLSKWVLYLLLFLVGIQIGASKNVLSAVRSMGFRIMLIPLATTIGTFAGTILIGFLLSDRSLSDVMAVGSGFAYYSLSSILISEYRGAELGTIALLANIMREFMVLVFTPWIARYFGKIAPICAGGATTMDTTLPIITRYCGSDYVVVALFHGMIIDFSVPLWVSLFLSF